MKLAVSILLLGLISADDQVIPNALQNLAKKKNEDTLFTQKNLNLEVDLKQYLYKELEIEMAVMLQSFSNQFLTYCK